MVINAVVLCWVTAGKHDQSTDYSHEPSTHTMNDPSKAYTSNIVLYSTASGDFSHPDAPNSAGPRSRFPRMFDSNRGHQHLSPFRRGADPVHGADSKSFGARSMPSVVLEEHEQDGVELVHINRTLDMDDVKDNDGLIRSSSTPSTSPLSPLISPPLPAHSSARRSNTVLNRHGVGSIGHHELQIVVTQETDVARDDALPALTKSPSPPESDEKW